MRRSAPCIPVLALIAVGAGCSGPSKNGGEATGPGDTEGATETASDVCIPAEEFNPAGCLEVAEFDPEARGRWPDIQRRQFDGAGHERSRDTRGGEEPNTERVCRTEWDGDRQLSETCAGISVYAYAYSYTAEGHPESARYDAGADGEIDKIWTYVTDDSGNIVEAAIDDDVDGTTDALQTFAWDEDGHRTEETWDYTYDGVVDFRRSYVWDDGMLVQELEDSDGDGSVDVEIVYEYNEFGRILRSEQFEDGSGTAAETTVWTYVDCALDNKVTFDAGGNRTTTTYVVDDLGRVVFQQEDWNDDGAADRFWATEWFCPT